MKTFTLLLILGVCLTAFAFAQEGEDNKEKGGQGLRKQAGRNNTLPQKQKPRGGQNQNGTLVKGNGKSEKSEKSKKSDKSDKKTKKDKDNKENKGNKGTFQKQGPNGQSQQQSNGGQTQSQSQSQG